MFETRSWEQKENSHYSEKNESSGKFDPQKKQKQKQTNKKNRFMSYQNRYYVNKSNNR